MMIAGNIIIGVINALSVLFGGIFIGLFLIKKQIKMEENKKLELEIKLLQQRADVLMQSEKIIKSLDGLLYQVKVSQEIDDLTDDKKGNC
jgi:hypothetical protein